jgi:Putative amidoligase enzyme
MSNICAQFGLSMYEHFTDPDAKLFVGVECEIEDIRDHSEIPSDLFAVTEDGSLRNNGHEYVSIPLSVQRSVDAFKQLHATLKKGSSAFSNRTSIHVHANCGNLDDLQVRSILYLYALYEEAFFAMVDRERRDNIHCVPLTETYLPSLYKEPLSRLYNRWHKYTALNIKPLGKYGTIEFRHMHGNDDPVLYAEWVGTINNLFSIGKSVDVSKINLTEEFLYETFRELFGATHISDKWLDIRSRMDNQIIDIKLIG